MEAFEAFEYILSSAVFHASRGQEDRFIRAAQRGELDVIKVSASRRTCRIILTDAPAPFRTPHFYPVHALQELLEVDPSLIKLEPHRNRSVYSPIEWAAMADHVPVGPSLSRPISSP